MCLFDERGYCGACGPAEQPYRGKRLLQGVAVAADLKDHRAGRELLIIAVPAAEDAVLLDTSGNTLEESIDAVCRLISEKTGRAMGE